MNYIINPWIIYLIDKAGTIFVMSLIVLLLSVMIFLVACILEVDDLCWTEESVEKCRKCRKISFIIGIITLIMVCVFPSSETITKMVVASYVTETNVDKAKEQIVDIVDYIFEKVDEVNN